MLIASKERVVRTSLLVGEEQTVVKGGFGKGDRQTLQASGNLAVAVDPKILPKEECDSWLVGM